MALVLRGSRSQSHTPAEEPQKSLEEAIKKFEGVIPDSDRIWLRKNNKTVPDVDAVMVFTAELDAVSRSKKGRSFGTRLHSVLQTVRQFTEVIDTFASSHPEIAALVWGGVKLTMLIVANYTSYFEEISNLFMRFKDHCPRFEEYRALFPTSKRLQSALCKFHASIIDCCTHVVEVLQRSKAKMLLNSLHQGFNKEFAPDAAKIETSGKEVKAEISLAQATSQRQHQELQKKEAEASNNKLLRIVSTSKITVEELKEMRLQRDELLSSQARQQLLESISSYDNRRPYKEACQKRHHSTAEWIFSTDQFKQWRTQPASSVLWCAGKIGSGKTVTTASAINHVARTKKSDQKIAYFFLQFDNPESLQAETFIRSIIRQLLDVTALPKDIELRLKSMDLNLLSDLDDWKELLLDIVSSLKGCYFFIDALDECELEEQRRILDVFSALAATVPGLRVFIASRFSMRKELERAFPGIGYISMESEGTMNDISIYVDEMVQRRIELGDLQVRNPCLIDEIKLKLVRHADGMFLWVTYLIDEICSQTYDEDIRWALNHLPKNLEETYYRALSRIQGPRIAIVQRVFLWVAVAKRNVTLGELGGAVSIEVGQKSLNPSRQLKDEDRLIYWCENLLHVDEEYRTVQFSHRTIYDFITGACTNDEYRDFHIQIEKADYFAGEICITYLSLNDFKTAVARRTQPQAISPVDIVVEAVSHRSASQELVRKLIHQRSKFGSEPQSKDLQALVGYTRSSGGLSKQKQTYPFLGYVSEHWISHTTKFNSKSTTWELWKYIAAGGNDMAWIPIETQNLSSTKLLQWAIQKRHHAMLCLAVPAMNDSTRDEAEIIMKQAMQEMARNGENDVLGILVSFGQSSDSIDDALIVACASGHPETVDLLLAANANVAHLGSAATIAYIYGHSDIVDGLLDHEAKVNSMLSPTPLSPLLAAAEAGNLDIVRKLLRAGADVDDALSLTRSPIQAAAEGGHLQVIECLIQAGADLNGRDEYWQTPLQAAAKNGHAPVVRCLIAAGANVNRPGPPFGTALEIASLNGYLDIVEYLIASMADIKGTVALQNACTNGHLDIVKRLIQAGAEIEVPGEEYPSALRVASEAGYVDIVKYLIARHANVNTSGYFGMTNSEPLQLACLSGHGEVVQCLIAAGANVNIVGVHEQTPLHLAAKEGHLNVVEYLLAANVEANGPADASGATPLLLALRSGHSEVVSMLLGAGADVNDLPPGVRARILSGADPTNVLPWLPKDILDS